jgi:diguanylate cyclase (GGDEF)-like protein
MVGMSVRRVGLLAMISVALIACAVFAAGRIERDSAVTAGQQAQAAQRLLTAMLDQETAARGYAVTGRSQFLSPWYEGEQDFASALATSRRLDSGDPALEQSLDDQQSRGADWRAAVLPEIERQQTTGRGPTVAESIADKALMDAFISSNALYSTELTERRDSSLATASWITAGLVAALSIALVLTGLVITRRSISRERRRTARDQELRELLQVSASQQESDMLLIRHVERVLPGSAAAILARGEDEDRLEPTVSADVEQTALQGIQTARLRSRSCQAMRLSRPYDRSRSEDPLMPCEVCGQVKAEIACEPLLVGGQVIGSVLVASTRRITERARLAVHEAAIQAAPILANQRNLALAEQRAVSDALTGLPNRRAADETVRRLAAMAGRSLSPLSVILLDLDRFKQLNDQHGHDQGDKALTTIGQVLTSSLRASDFAARYGGEEFLLVLPDTDRTGALEVAEKVRQAIERVEMPRVGAITGSFGVACLPDDAVEPDQLIRKADRALYAAKARGRNRVEAAETVTDWGGLPSAGDRRSAGLRPADPGGPGADRDDLPAPDAGDDDPA